jgi:hypothetical protein
MMIISINKSYKSSSSIYDAVRKSWTASKKNAEECDLVLAERFGVCVGVFKPSIWFVSKENPKRIEFEGVEAEKEIAELYYNKRTPEKRKGAMLPFRYFDASFDYEEHMKAISK